MTAAGWYPDPGVPGRARYWDGEQWTGHVSALQAPPTPVAPVMPVAPVSPAAPSEFGEPASPAAPAAPFAPAPESGGYGPGAPFMSAGPSAPPAAGLYAIPKNSKATIAMVLGIVSLLINPFCVLSILAISYGVKGRKQTREAQAAGYPPVGSGAATAGIVLGIIGSVSFVLLFVYQYSRL